MAQVPDQVLRWLWNALQSGYHNPQPTYSDAVSALSSYPTLQPRTEVYTYNNGQPALLLCLSGTLPVNFRGTVYRFPLKIWVPQGHPHDPEGVMVFVVPAETMMIRPGQHISVDGRVYHPYLRDWSTSRQSNIVDFLRLLQDIFAREPPVVAKPQQQQQQQLPQSPAQRPPPPPKQRPSSVIQQHAVEMPAGPHPPPKPPKPGDQVRGGIPVQYTQKDVDRDGPPLPPLPHERRQQGYQSPQSHQGQANGFATPPNPQSMYASANGISSSNLHNKGVQSFVQGSPVSPLSPGALAGAGRSDRYTHAPPLPQHPPQGMPRQQQQAHPSYENQRQQQQPLPQQYQQMPSYPQNQPQQQQQYTAQPQPQQQHPPQQQQQQQQQQHYQQHKQYPYQQQPLQAAAQKPRPAQPPVDLLSDPFDITLPANPSHDHTAPPIPPNPEKEHLLHLLSQSLVAQANAKISQTQSALPMLHAQNQAMQEAHQRIQHEISQVEQLDRTLASNESILQANMQACDKVIEESKKMSLPDIDHVLVAPTLVQNQLWSIEAEIAGLREAVWVLQRAVGAGRVGAQDFVRLNRGLGRELFLKMALSRKIARGLGLDVGEGSGGGGRGGDEGFYT